jgi:UDP-N-acetylmuramate--alanine ligase
MATTTQIKFDSDAASSAPLAQPLIGRRVHFVGVGGSGMCGLAHMLLKEGAIVTGTDRQQSDATDKLAALGITIGFEQGAENLPAETELVVYSAAVKPDNPQLTESQRRGLETLKYAQMLGRVMNLKHGIAIAGTHGKSTTTALLSFMLTSAGMDPSYVVGATCDQLGGSSHGGSGEFFVAEACEYDRSFLNLYPRLAVILNIEKDHLDYYKDLDEITEAFGQLMSQVHPDGLIITSAVDQHCLSAAHNARAKVETYAVDAEADWSADQITRSNGHIEFRVLYLGRTEGHLRLGIPGRHNIGNSLAAAAIARNCGLNWEQISTAIAGFHGARRRSQFLGSPHGVTVIDDYAHHPTEIHATLSALRDHYQPARLICVFQPHQHSRTRVLLDEFSTSFSKADLVIVPDIYFVRDTESDRKAVNSRVLVDRLCANGVKALHIPAFPEVTDYLVSSVQSGDLVVSMGAGPVWEVTHDLVHRL